MQCISKYFAVHYSIISTESYMSDSDNISLQTINRSISGRNLTDEREGDM